jgi:hypothetical protein
MAVITTKYVLDQKSPILNVYHFEDGYWQFSGPEEDLPDSDYRIVALEEIISLDSSILEISTLPYGSNAYRKDHMASWVIN